MSVETKANLKPETVSKLQDLIRINIDAYDGLLESAEEISDPGIAKLFRELSHERSKLATELQEHVSPITRRLAGVSRTPTDCRCFRPKVVALSSSIVKQASRK